MPGYLPIDENLGQKTNIFKGGLISCKLEFILYYIAILYIIINLIND